MPAFDATQTTSLQPQFHCSPTSVTSSQLAALTAAVQKPEEQLDQITQILAAMQNPSAPQSSQASHRDLQTADDVSVWSHYGARH